MAIDAARFVLLNLASDYVEGELYLVPDSNQSMDGGSCFDFEVAAVDAELSQCPQCLSGYGDLRWNRN